VYGIDGDKDDAPDNDAIAARQFRAPERRQQPVASEAMSQGACMSAGAPANAGPIKHPAILRLLHPTHSPVRGWPRPWRLPHQGRGHAAPGVLRGGASALKRRTELMMWPWRGSNARVSNQRGPTTGAFARRWVSLRTRLGSGTRDPRSQLG
jgi:hypothetical protein